MLGIIDRAARIIAVVALVIGIVLLVWWLSGDQPRKYLRTDLVTAQEGDTFFTGFASIGVVRFRSSGDLRTLKYMRQNDRIEEADGYCYRLYELSIGYPSLRAAVTNAEAASGDVALIADPQILSANVIDARHGGEKVSTSECDSQELVTTSRPNATRLQALQQELADNGQWDSQRQHGQRVLASFSARLTLLRKAAAEKRIQALSQSQQALQGVSDRKALGEWAKSARENLDAGSSETDAALRRTETVAPGGLGPDLDSLKRDLRASLDREIGAQRADFARAGGYLGALKLTFSTIGIFSQDKGRWFWKREEFYVRQDLAEATYGTDFARHVAMVKGGFFSPRRLVIRVPEPRLLALDRYSTLQVTRKSRGFSLKNDDDGTGVEKAMRADLEKFMDTMNPQAIRFAKSALTAQMLSLAGEDVADVEVQFERDDADGPSQLAELIRGMQEQRRADAREARED